MPRIFSATYTPYTYEELAAPVREATAAHQKVEEDYNNNMLVVDSLRQRAMNEPDAKWAKQITDYANQLEGYAMDLARNGLTRETRGNLLNMKRGYGTTVSPVLMAMQREKELQSVRDKNPDIRNVFSTMPTIDLIIANPNIGLNWYSGSEIFNEAQALADAASKRNVDSRVPENISNIFYRYGKTTGFTNEEIADIEKNPVLGPILQRVYQKYGWNRDFDEGSRESNQLKNEAITGMMAGVSYNEDWHYQQRPDYHDPKYWLEYEKLNRELHPERYGTLNLVLQLDPRKPRLPELDFGITPLLRTQVDNNNTRNKMINDKNIVIGTRTDVNGTHYDISKDYVLNILDGLNGKAKVNKWIPYGVTPMDIRDPQKEANSEQKKLADWFGITKNDDINSATRKILKRLEHTADYTDMADATLHTGLRIRIDSENYNDVKSHYEKKKGSLDIQELGPDGLYKSTGKTLTKEDYDPVYVFVDQNGPYQVWMNKEGDTEVTPYYDQRAYTLIRDAYNGNNGVMYYLREQNKLFDNFANTIKSYGIDSLDEGRLRAVGYDKGKVIQYINQSGNTTTDNMNLSYSINGMLARYYEAEAAEWEYRYNSTTNPQEKNECAKQYKVAKTRQLNAEEQINILNVLSSKIDEAAAGINEMVMTDVPVTNQYTGQKYQGNTFKP